MKCILIVEDEKLIALDLSHACEDAGIAAIVAGSSRQAIEAIAANDAIDGAILDANLGRGETCEAVAEVLRARGIPFVLHTGDRRNADEYLRGIAAPVIGKPNAAEAVVAQLIELAGRPS